LTFNSPYWVREKKVIGGGKEEERLSIPLIGFGISGDISCGCGCEGLSIPLIGFSPTRS